MPNTSYAWQTLQNQGPSKYGTSQGPSLLRLHPQVLSLTKVPCTKHEGHISASPSIPLLNRATKPTGFHVFILHCVCPPRPCAESPWFRPTMQLTAPSPDHLPSITWQSRLGLPASLPLGAAFCFPNTSYSCLPQGSWPHGAPTWTANPPLLHVKINSTVTPPPKPSPVEIHLYFPGSPTEFLYLSSDNGT